MNENDYNKMVEANEVKEHRGKAALTNLTIAAAFAAAAVYQTLRQSEADENLEGIKDALREKGVTEEQIEQAVEEDAKRIKNEGLDDMVAEELGGETADELKALRKKRDLGDQLSSFSTGLAIGGVSIVNVLLKASRERNTSYARFKRAAIQKGLSQSLRKAKG